MDQIKEHVGCEDCGVTDPRYLEFHHREPADKEFVVGGRLTAPMERVLKELEKCDILCRHCHHRLHDIPGLLV